MNLDYQIQFKEILIFSNTKKCNKISIFSINKIKQKLKSQSFQANIEKCFNFFFNLDLLTDLWTRSTGLSGRPHGSARMRCSTFSGCFNVQEAERYPPKLCPHNIIFFKPIFSRHFSIALIYCLEKKKLLFTKISLWPFL